VGKSPPDLSARNALLMEFESGAILLAKDIDQKSPPASLTKLMTLKLAFEALDSGKVKASDLVPVSELAWKTGGSRMFLRVGSKVKFEDLIKGAIVASGNDACVAIAEFVGGTVENFVTMMNRRAREMGLAGTSYVDPHGISDDNQTTARDAANLARNYIRDHPASLAIHSMREFTYTPEGGKPIRQENRNRLLGQYQGVDGLKTGHTEASGYSLIATAERGGMRLVAIVMGIKAKTEPLGEQLRAREAARILDWGYGGFVTATLLAKGEQLALVKVWKGRQDAVAAGAASEVKFVVEKGAEPSVQRNVSLSEPIIAPVKKDQVLGSVSVTLAGQEIQKVPVVALQEIQAGSIFRRFIDSIKLMFQRSSEQ
jgi:D-alanyl-D-alanine carboxypeptidase (penicillin-binding protein 5/6)